MDSCPKCEGINISGPKYVSTSFVGITTEWLEYTCDRCGFKKRTATKDFQVKQLDKGK